MLRAEGVDPGQVATVPLTASILDDLVAGRVDAYPVIGFPSPIAPRSGAWHSGSCGPPPTASTSMATACSAGPRRWRSGPTWSRHSRLPACAAGATPSIMRLRSRRGSCASCRRCARSAQPARVQSLSGRADAPAGAARPGGGRPHEPGALGQDGRGPARRRAAAQPAGSQPLHLRPRPRGDDPHERLVRQIVTTLAVALASLLLAALWLWQLRQQVRRATAALEAGEQRFGDFAEAASDWFWSRTPLSASPGSRHASRRSPGSASRSLLGRRRDEITTAAELGHKAARMSMT